MRIVAIMHDLMLFSRIDDAAAAASGRSAARIDSPASLSEVDDVDLVLVDWTERDPDWADALVALRRRAPETRLILFGRHTDIEAHRAARAAGLGPMWARSKVVSELPGLAAGQGTPAPPERPTRPARPVTGAARRTS